MAEFAKLIFESKEVFFTTKLIYCMAFGIPRKVIPMGRDLDKILTISISYEERITKDFVARYRLHFDVSDKAICKYYIANKKTSNLREAEPSECMQDVCRTAVSYLKK